jgi:hypothetical protein
MKLIFTILTFFVVIIASTNVRAQIVPEQQKESQEQVGPEDPDDSDNEEHKPESLINDVLLSIGFNLNYDVNTFIPSLGGDSKVGKNLGLDLRFNQGAFIPKSYAEMERTSYYRINEVTDEDLISILKQDYIDNSQKAESYLAMSIAPTWKIKDEFPIYLVAHLEFVRKTTDFITNTTISNEENIQIEPDRLEDFPIRNSRIVAGERVSTTNDHIFNGGVGFKFYKDINEVTVNLKMIGGRGTNPDLSIISTDEANRDKNGFYYLTHFEVAERKFGIKLGGEIRGLFRPNNYNNLHPIEKRGYEPYSNIYIAKVFKFSKISELISL